VNDPHVMPTYARYPVTLVRGSGTRVWDDESREYLDFAGALGVNVLGHSHPSWVAAVRAQLDTLDMVSNLFATEPQAALAGRLAELMPVNDARVFFCNSGAEANEAAIKLARKCGLARGKATMIALDGSFHGRTIAALAATGQRSKRTAFEPLVDWFRFVPAGDIDSLASAMTDEVIAVLLEPVLAEGGVHPLDDAYLRGVRALCDERGALLVADEVQSGMGRCGDWAALQHAGVEADVLTLAKGLGGGLPIGAMLARRELSFEAGEHGSTFGGGPVVCAGALAVIDAIERGGLLARAVALGESLFGAAAAAAPEGTVLEARGRGCLWGFQLARPVANDVVLAMIDGGVLATTAGPDVVRMSPPLTASVDDVALATRAFGAAVARVLTPAGARRTPSEAST
jgi:acetylornithine/N-succinyldiaminopimelate aminotransferase